MRFLAEGTVEEKMMTNCRSPYEIQIKFFFAFLNKIVIAVLLMRFLSSASPVLPCSTFYCRSPYEIPRKPLMRSEGKKEIGNCRSPYEIR